MATELLTPSLHETMAASHALPAPRTIVVKTMVVHTVTYFFAGAAAYAFFDYATLMSQPPLNGFIRPLNHPMVMAGPLLQPIRGVLFGFVFCLLRESFFQKTKGWLTMWAVLAGVGILGTFGAPPSSIEGLIYNPLPISTHLILLPEVLAQSFLLAWLVYTWVNQPGKKWLNWVMGVLFAFVLLLPAMGLASMAAK